MSSPLKKDQVEHRSTGGEIGEQLKPSTEPGFFGKVKQWFIGGSGQEALTNAQSAHTGEGLVRAVESELRHNQETLSKEEAVERSWEFLTNITERVSRLPPELQDKIMQMGKKLSESGAIYNHVVPSNQKLPKSPAKDKAQKQQSHIINNMVGQ